MTTTDTPADELRAAAKLIRERAEAATPGPWERPLDTRHRNFVGAALPANETGRWEGGIIPGYMTSGYLSRYVGQRERVCVVSCESWSDGHFVRKRSGRDLDFIAGMHPGVALAVADLLEAASTCECEEGDDHADIKQAALAIARAYLAGESP